MVCRFGIWYIDMVIYHIDMFFLNIDMGCGLMILEMTVCMDTVISHIDMGSSDTLSESRAFPC
jgi:hypothetical protein